LLYLPQSYYEEARLGDILSRFQSDTAQIRTFIGSSAAVTIRSVLQLLAGSALLIVSSPKLTLLVFSLIPLVMIPILVLGYKVQKLTAQSQNLDGQAAAVVEESLSAISTVKSFVNETYNETTFENIMLQQLAVTKKRTRYRALLVSSIIGLVFIAVAVILWFGMQQLQSKTLTAGQLSSFIFYAILVVGSINSLADVLGESATAMGATNRLIDLFNIPAEEGIRDVSPREAKSRVQRIEFNQVSFSYPQHQEKQTITQLSFIVPPYKRVALVGPSGAGKSTILKLLLRFYTPQDGQIFLDNIPSKDFNLPHLRSQFSLVPQDPMIFHASLFDNIRYGKPLASKDEIFTAAHAAFVDEFAAQLPEGYQTLVGEKGARLSGGQKQRIALARAILKDAPIFLLDEATNALDSYSEQIVQQTLGKVLKNKTALMIAHRLSTVQEADLILVLDHGVLIAQGQHADLLKTCKLYKTLAETQLLLT